MNNRFSRESLYEINIVKNHAIGINFVPLSDAYKKYGASVVINELLEIEEIRKNYELKIDTEGFIKASGFLSKGLEKEDIEMGFLTNEIDEIEYYNPT